MDFKQYRLDVNKAIDINSRVTDNLKFYVEQVDKQWYVYVNMKALVGLLTRAKTTLIRYTGLILRS